MEILNRTALIVTPKRRCLDWANGLPQAGKPLEIGDVLLMRTIYLLATGDEIPDVEELIDEYCDEIFEEFLERWPADESLWPVNRNPHTFRDWFAVELVDVVHDADPQEPVTISEVVLTQCAICDAPLDSDRQFVVLGDNRVRRLSAEEAEQWEQAIDEGNGPPVNVELVFRCCSAACTAVAEETLGRVLVERPQRNDNDRSPEELN
jgi:hypothetical protein